MSAGALPGALLVLGISIIAGFLGHAIFRRYRVSDILVLLAVGFVLGPLLGWVDAGALGAAMPILGPIGLSIILFEGGLELRWDDVRRHGWGALGFTLLAWSLTVGALTFAFHGLVGLPWHLALLLGCAVGATGIVAVIPILAQVRAPAKARVWLTVETGVGDLLSAVSVTALSALYLFGGSPATFGMLFAAQTILGAAVGFLVGLGWARILHHVRDRVHAYALTLGALLLAYALTEAIGGSGYLCALVLGLVLGNADPLMRHGGVPALASLSERARLHQGEIIFLLRSLYFVYLGLMLSRDILTPATALVVLALGATLVAARLVAVMIAHRVRSDDDRRARILLAGMMPRAMAAAVLASIPIAAGVPGAEPFVTTTLLVIVGADIATTIGLFAYERDRRAHAPAPGPVQA